VEARPSGAARVKKLARLPRVCQNFFAVQFIFKPERNRQNLARQQNGGPRFDGRCFAAIFALLARG
jgi:hypothetical protein